MVLTRTMLAVRKVPKKERKGTMGLPKVPSFDEVVPYCQKEQISRKRKRNADEVTINDMPNEILLSIFECLDSQEDIGNLKMVCRHWSLIVDEIMGQTVFIGSDALLCPNLVHKRAHWKPFPFIAKRGIRHCFMNHPIFSIEDVSKKFMFLRPGLLKTFHLEGFIPVDIFNRLIQPLTNMVVLELHISTIGTWDNPFSVDTLNTLHIKELYLTSDGFKKDQKPYCSMINLVENLMCILTANFSHLVLLGWHIPIFWDFEFQMFTTLFSFLVKHSRTIVEFKLTHPGYWKANESRRLGDVLITAQQAADAFTNLEPTAVRPEVQRLYMNLKVFHYSCRLIKHFPWSSRYWEYFLGRCTNLTTFSFNVYRNFTQRFDLPNLSPTVATTLVNAEIVVMPNHTNPLDFSAFSHCKQLKSLTLGSSENIPRFILPLDELADGANAHAININMLPASLVSLKVTNLWLGSEQLDAVVNTLPKLNHLYLVNVGRSHGLGLTLRTLLILSDKVFNSNSFKLKLIKSINYKSLADGDLLQKLKESDSSKVRHSWVNRFINYALCTNETSESKFMQKGCVLWQPPTVLAIKIERFVNRLY